MQLLFILIIQFSSQMLLLNTYLKLSLLHIDHKPQKGKCKLLLCFLIMSQFPAWRCLCGSLALSNMASPSTHKLCVCLWYNVKYFMAYQMKFLFADIYNEPKTTQLFTSKKNVWISVKISIQSHKLVLLTSSPMQRFIWRPRMCICTWHLECCVYCWEVWGIEEQRFKRVWKF